MRKSWKLLIGRILFTSFFGYALASLISNWERSTIASQRLLTSDYVDYKASAMATNSLSILWCLAIGIWVYMMAYHIIDFLRTEKNIDKKKNK